MTPLAVAVRAYRAARFGARELLLWRQLSGHLGIRRALFQRLRHHLEVDRTFAELQRRLEQQEELLRAHEARAAAAAERQQDQLAALRRADAALQELAGLALQRVTGEAHTRAAQVAEARAALAQPLEDHAAAIRRVEGLVHGNHAVATAEAARLRQDAHGALARICSLEAQVGRSERIFATTRWLEQAAVPEDALISVILPAHGRNQLLPRALASLSAQSYQNWELVVVDDEGSAAEAVAACKDARVRLLRVERMGVCAARNRGLAEARGQLIAYLDDDNTFAPGWLKGVAWGFHERPDLDVLYGARVLEKLPGDNAAPGEPLLHFEPWDRDAIETHNFVDLNVLAHRAGLPEARFDESLTACVDWDLLLRLTRRKPPLELPVLAAAYAVTTPGRISDRASPELALERVRSLHRRPRVLALSGDGSAASDELRALAQQGARVAFCRQGRPAAPMPVQEPLFDSLEQALREFQPDVLLLHRATHAAAQLPLLESAGVPFAVRVHSVDLELPRLHELLRHPLCLGAWAAPQLATQAPGVHALAPLLTHPLPPPAAKRELILSVGSGRPGKDWALLAEALARLEGERRIVVGVASGHEQVPSEVALLLAQHRSPPLLQVNLEREQVLQLLARAAALVYTLEPGANFGMPMSVVEGLCSGASVILPDRPEARDFAGPHARFYKTAADLAAHAQHALAGGRAVDEERLANRHYGLTRFGAESAQQAFFDQLNAALKKWRAQQGRAVA